MTIGALDGGGRRAKGHHLAVARAADLLPVAVRREDQVRAGGLPVRRAGPARTSSCSSASPTRYRGWPASCAAVNLSLHGEGGEHILDGLTFSFQAAEPYRDRGPGRQRQGGTHPGPRRVGRAQHRAGDHQRQGPAQLCPKPCSDGASAMSAIRRMIFAGTIEDNLLYGLKYRPQRPRPPGEDALSRAGARAARGATVWQQPVRSAGGLGRLCRGRNRGAGRIRDQPDPRAGAGAGWTATCSAWACAAPSRRAPTPSSRTSCSRRGGPCSTGCRRAPICRGWSSRSTPSATTPTPASPRTCCSARRSATLFDPERIADQPYVQRDARGDRVAR